MTGDAVLNVDDGGGGPSDNVKCPATLLSRSLSKVSNTTYNTRKTMAQGMMDIALLTANANQLRYILQYRHEKSANFLTLLVLIACSLVLQVGSSSSITHTAAVVFPPKRL